MKKVRLLCLLALLFAVGSAFTTTKFEKTIFRISEGNGEFHWELSQPVGKECTDPIAGPCSYLLEDTAPIPDDNEEPTTGVLDPSEEQGAYE